MRKLRIANFIARKSVTKWNKNPFSRRFYRALRHSIEFCSEQFSIGRKVRLQEYYGEHSHKHTTFRYDAKFGRNHRIDTMPWLLKNPNYANWPLEDDPENYNLVGDRFGWVIRMGTWYVNMKHLEVTGRPLQSEGICHAKQWGPMLERNGYHQVEDPTGDHKGWPRTRYYIGVNPHVGEYGQVYWFEADWTDMSGTENKRCILASTYKDGHHYIEKIEPDDKNIQWYEIS